MDPITQQTTLASAGGKKDPVYVDDVFSTYLHAGENSSSTINNGIDLSGEGGLVWVKTRDNTYSHFLFDTERGTTKAISSNLTNAEFTESKGVTAFNSNGFNIGGSGGDIGFNGSGTDYAYWTFRKAPGFFDVVTYTGNGTAGRTVSHNLGSVPGCILIKRIDSADGWAVYHKNTEGYFNYDPPENLITFLSNSSAATGGIVYWNDTVPTSSVFTLGSNSIVNGSGMSYVAYVFASEEAAFGANGNESIIKCGSYTGNGTSGSSVNSIDLGFEPQWVMIKKTSSTGNWLMFDTMRGFPAVGSEDEYIYANSNNAAAPHQYGGPTSTGFQVEGTDGDANGNGATYIYIAIRRPHKPPETAAKCFDVFTQAGSNSTQLRPGTAGSSVTDMALIKNTGSNYDWVLGTRSMGPYNLATNNSSAESTGRFGTSINVWDQMSGTELQGGVSGINESSGNYVNYHFTRKPGFFDVVAYAGHQYRDASTNISSVPHNLGVVPEMIWIKSRNLSSSSSKWVVYHKDLGTSSFGVLNLDETVSTNYFLGNTPTNSVFKLFAGGFSTVDTSGNDYVAYLFATLPGISKVGSFTGDGASNRTIDCGFTTGARFVMIKRTDSSASWFVFDSARGIVSGNDPYSVFNQDSADVTSTDFIDPNNVGFEIDTNNSDINASGGSYIFYAIA